MTKPNSTPNHLIHEKSQYLLSHAYNPVNWYPWGEEAFAKAKKEDKMIFLSIGYATCHWCHVMERESFEDESTAKLLNEYFVSIKLDREERPDIDKIYMDAIQAMSGQGGWPLNIFLTPEKHPVAGGTYFPPVPKYGRRSFQDICKFMQSLWTQERERALNAAKDLMSYLLGSKERETSNEFPSSQIFAESIEKFESVFDFKQAGFLTNSSNKFPPSLNMEFLLHEHSLTASKICLLMVCETSIAMRLGGIYDQIGGGLCRYSTDHEWLVPHFEKMLYDNSLFISVLAKTYQLSLNPFFLESALDTISYIERDLLEAGGGISSAEDADSEGVEGKFYVWEFSELKEILKEDFDFYERLWNFTPEGNFEEKNILHETYTFQNSKILKSNSEKIKIQRGKEYLLSVRNERIRPLKDTKILTSWNCLYVQSLLDVYDSNLEAVYLEKAIRTFGFLEKNLWADQMLYRRFRDGEQKFLGTLSDYAEWIFASLRLFTYTFEKKYWAYAMDAMKILDSEFLTESGVYYESSSKSQDLIRRSIESYDGVEPSGNSTMVLVFHFLYSLGLGEYQKKGESILKYFQTDLERNPLAHSRMLLGLRKFMDLPKQLLFVHEDAFSIPKKTREQWNRDFYPYLKLLIPKSKLVDLQLLFPILQNKDLPDGKKGILFECQNGVCNLPEIF